MAVASGISTKARETGSGTSFADLNNINIDDASVARAPSATGVTKSIIGYDYGFAIPPGSEILNLSCSTRYVSTGGVDNSLFLVNPDNITPNRADPTNAVGTLREQTWEGDSVYWGVALTSVIINSSDFGVSYSGRTTKNSVFGIEWFRLTVTYSDIITGKISVKVSGEWKDAIAYVKQSGIWKQADEVFVKQNGLWEKVYG